MWCRGVEIVQARCRCVHVLAQIWSAEVLLSRYRDDE